MSKLEEFLAKLLHYWITNNGVCFLFLFLFRFFYCILCVWRGGSRGNECMLIIERYVYVDQYLFDKNHQNNECLYSCILRLWICSAWRKPSTIVNNKQKRILTTDKTIKLTKLWTNKSVAIKIYYNHMNIFLLETL